MPPPLHPRSGFTTTLFSATLALSFLVVGLPHVLPCPVDPTQYAEGNMRKFQNVPSATNLEEETRRGNEQELMVEGDRDGQIRVGSSRQGVRECPVPKPRGIIGQMLGLSDTQSQSKPPRVVKIQDSTPRENPQVEGGG